MYGIVLMAALATGSGTPSADATPPIVVAPMVAMPSTGCFSSGCGGGVMMSGGCYSSGCCGGSYSSCYSSSCTGCCGGGFLGLRSRMSGLFNRSSCGGCYSSSCYGSSCFGSACYGGGCYGGGCTGGGCTGGGCYGGAHYYGSDFHGGYDTGVIVGSATPRQSLEFSAARTKPDAAPARLTIEVPAGAKLFVDGQLTKGEGTSRNFHTPDLADGQTFFYDLKAEVVVDGRPVTETKRVIVRSGDALTESFPKLIAALQNGGDPALLVSKPR